MESQLKTHILTNRIMGIAQQDDIDLELRSQFIDAIVDAMVGHPRYNEGYETGKKDAYLEPENKLPHFAAGFPEVIKSLRIIKQICDEVKLTTEAEERIYNVAKDALKDLEMIHDTQEKPSSLSPFFQSRQAQ